MGETGQRMNRRQLLVGAGGVAGTALFPVEAVAHDPNAGSEAVSDDGSIAATMERVESASAAYIRTPDRSTPWRIEILPSGSVLRLGPATLEEFTPGDEVVIHGIPRPDGVLMATAVELMFRVVEAVVTAHRGDRLETTEGSMTLTSDTRPRGGYGLGHAIDARPVERLKKGDTVVVLGRRAPGGEFVALDIGVVADG